MLPTGVGHGEDRVRESRYHEAPIVRTSLGKSLRGMSRRTQVLLALVLAAAVVSAVGTIFTSITRTQTVISGVSLSTNPATFPNVVFGVPFLFSVETTNSNPAGSPPITFHLSLRATCPSGGIAGLSGQGSGNACSTTIETGSFVANPGSTVLSDFSVTYTGALGTYTWTIEAHSG